MPIYEYECPDCGRFEKIQKITDDPLSECPTCKDQGKSNSIERLVSQSAFHLKGSGWYKTDYGSSGSGAGTSRSKDSSSDTSSGSSASSGSSSSSGGACCKGGSCDK